MSSCLSSMYFFLKEPGSATNVDTYSALGPNRCSQILSAWILCQKYTNKKYVLLHDHVLVFFWGGGKLKWYGSHQWIKSRVMQSYFIVFLKFHNKLILVIMIHWESKTLFYLRVWMQGYAEQGTIYLKVKLNCGKRTVKRLSVNTTQFIKTAVGQLFYYGNCITLVLRG